MRLLKYYVLLFSMFVFSTGLLSQPLSLAFPFADHGVLQRGKPIPVWGKSLPGSRITLTLGAEEVYGYTDLRGRWIVYFPSLPAGGPYSLIVTNEHERLERKDIYIGDVWLASGQSNMAWMLKNGIGVTTEKEIAQADFPLIRFLNVPNVTHSTPTECLEPVNWQLCTPQNAANFSAVAYFFARELHCDRNVPVGIVSASWGATNIEAWMSGERLRTENAYTEWVDTFDTDSLRWQNYVVRSRENDRMRDVLAKKADRGIRAKVFLPSYNDKEWPVVDTPVTTERMKLKDFWGVAWLRTSFALPPEMAGDTLILDGDINAQSLELWLNGSKLTATSGHRFTFPTHLLHSNNQLTARVVVHWNSAWLGTNQHPLMLSTLDGASSFVLNSPWRFNATLEPKLPGWQNYYNTNTVIYNGMIHPLMPYGLCGILWYQGENNAGQGQKYRTLLPMLIDSWRVGFRQGELPFITVQLANYMKRRAEPSESKWAELREAQALSLCYPQTGLVTTIDIGEANDIHPRNKLDVGRRLYAQARSLVYGDSIAGRGPSFCSMQVVDDKIYLKFDNALYIKDGGKPKSFAIAGMNRQFYWVDEAHVEGDTVILRSDRVSEPIAVRYAWADNPEVNLCNKEGLPVIPFRTDSWE